MSFGKQNFFLGGKKKKKQLTCISRPNTLLWFAWFIYHKLQLGLTTKMNIKVAYFINVMGVFTVQPKISIATLKKKIISNVEQWCMSWQVGLANQGPADALPCSLNY